MEHVLNFLLILVGGSFAVGMVIELYLSLFDRVSLYPSGHHQPTLRDNHGRNTRRTKHTTC
jgi:hypothetical protein